MIRKGQVRWLAKGDVLSVPSFTPWLASPRKKPLSICMASCRTSPPFATDREFPAEMLDADRARLIT